MRTGWLWPVYGDSDEIVFHYAPSRAHRHVHAFLGMFRGTLLSDGYEAYAAYAGQRPGEVTHAQCWSHTRRGFERANDGDPEAVAKALAMLGAMYGHEKQIHADTLTGDDKRAYRQTHIRPVVETFWRWCRAQCHRTGLLPKSPLAKALNYALERRSGLEVFLDDPEVAIDTNHLERALRPIPMGKRNWLFASTEVGTRRVGIIQSLLVTCRLHAAPAMFVNTPSHCAMLRDKPFDFTLVFGSLGLVFLAGATLLVEPALFYPILVIDLWVLGYHHVIATFTRLCFDKASFTERRWMIVYLLPAIAAATALVAWQLGLWVIVTIYFYWQWWHYTRQSWGISRAYRRAAPNALYEGGWLDQATFYAVPLYGILLRSSEQHPTFLTLDLWSVPVPAVLASSAGVAAAVLVALWVARRVVAAAQRRLATMHTLYMVTHFTIFAVAYVWIPDITFGWLLINIWHNFQYIAFVWLFNNRRFRSGVDPQARFLSYISQSGRMWLYMLACIIITKAIYWGVLRTID